MRIRATISAPLVTVSQSTGCEYHMSHIYAEGRGNDARDPSDKSHRNLDDLLGTYARESQPGGSFLWVLFSSS
jgi:hypothetical protein